MNIPYIKLAICTLIAAILALTSHIYISEWTGPFIAKMLEGLQQVPEIYPMHVMIAAYFTAFVTVGLIVFLYYQAGHLLTIPNRIIKILILTAIMLELKGALFRQPLMDYIVNSSLSDMKHPFVFALLSNADKWIATLLISICLVYFCPVKNKAASLST